MSRIRRPGISIIEVLFAIGIAIVGLLGVIALIPVGSYHAGRSLTSDTATRVGLNAQREFMVRGYAAPEMWRGAFDATTLEIFAPDGTSTTVNIAADVHPFLPPSAVSLYTYRGFNTAVSPPAPAATDAFWVVTPSIGTGVWNVPQSTDAFCIDPLFLSANGTTAEAQLFPYYPANSSTTSSGMIFPRMHRISVAGIPTAQPNPTIPNAVAASLAIPSAINFAQASEIFISTDDVAVDIDDSDKTIPPTPQMIVDEKASGSDVPIKQQFEGQYSWIATLVPKVGAANGASELYILSIIVFKQRNVSYAIDGVNERVLDVTAVSNSSTGHIDVIVAAEQASFAQDYLAVSTGDWVMLQGSTASIPFFRWYQVIGTSDEAQSNGANWERYVTLSGPEWLPATYPISATPPTYGQMVLLEGIVGVYEKTIRLETTSLWRK